jgi:hypothetical protein
MEALALMAGLNRLTVAIAADDSLMALRMREAIESARAKLIEHRNIDVEWRR